MSPPALAPLPAAPARVALPRRGETQAGGRASLGGGCGSRGARHGQGSKADLNSLFMSAFQSQPGFHFNGRVRLGAPLSLLSGAEHLLLKAVPRRVEQIMVLAPALVKSRPVGTSRTAPLR